MSLLPAGECFDVGDPALDVLVIGQREFLGFVEVVGGGDGDVYDGWIGAREDPFAGFAETGVEDGGGFVPFGLFSVEDGLVGLGSEEGLDDLMRRVKA